MGECAEGVAPGGDDEGGTASAEAVEGGKDVGAESPRRGEEWAVGVGRHAAEGVGGEQSDVGTQKKRERIKELIRPLIVGYPNAVAAVGVPKWKCLEILRHPA